MWYSSIHSPLRPSFDEIASSPNGGQWRAKSSIIQPWIVRFRSHLVQSSIVSQPILYNRSRSKGWKSRSQRNVRYVSAEENAMTEEPIGWQTSNLVWASLLLRRIMTGATSGGLRLQCIAITIFCRSWILIDFEHQPFSSSRRIRFKCYRSGSSNYWILWAVINNICIKELSRHRSLHRSVMTSLTCYVQSVRVSTRAILLRLLDHRVWHLYWTKTKRLNNCILW